MNYLIEIIRIQSVVIATIFGTPCVNLFIHAQCRSINRTVYYRSVGDITTVPSMAFGRLFC